MALGTEPLTRVSVFLSVLDVHIVRAPVGGKIIHSAYVPGAFLNAELDKASEENERQAFVIETASRDQDRGGPDRRARGAADRDFRERGG